MEDTGKRAGGELGEYSYSRSADMRERSFGDIVKSIIANVQEIIRSEVRLAKAEVREEGERAATAGRNLAIGGVTGLFAALFLLNAVMFGLTAWMPLWASAALIGIVLGVAALVLLQKGRTEWKQFSPKPEKTVETVKENVAWIKSQTRS